MGKYGFLVGREHEVLIEMEHFSRGLAERAEAFGISPADAAEARRLVDAAKAAVAACNPAMRTQMATAAKKVAMAAAKAHCKRLGNFIRVNPNISDSDRVDVGVPPVPERRRIPAPTTTPMLSIARVIPGGHEVETFDSASPDRRGKAKDAKGLELFVAYSPAHGDTGLGMESILKNGQPFGILTRPRTSVIHPDERVGSVANYIGRWVNGRHEAGPWSQPVRMILAMPGGQIKRSVAA